MGVLARCRDSAGGSDWIRLGFASFFGAKPFLARFSCSSFSFSAFRAAFNRATTGSTGLSLAEDGADASLEDDAVDAEDDEVGLEAKLARGSWPFCWIRCRMLDNGMLGVCVFWIEYPLGSGDSKLLLILVALGSLVLCAGRMFHRRPKRPTGDSAGMYIFLVEITMIITERTGRFICYCVLVWLGRLLAQS